MVDRVKDKGLKELQSFKRRVLRVASFTRISKADADWLVEHTEEIERYVGRMNERPEREREFL